jgi:hypothetical protein
VQVPDVDVLSRIAYLLFIKHRANIAHGFQ